MIPAVYAEARILGPFATALGAGDSLQAQNSNPIINGAIAQVISNSQQYYFDKTSAAAPVGDDVIQPVAGPGRWLKQPGGGGPVSWADLPTAIGNLSYTGLKYFSFASEINNATSTIDFTTGALQLKTLTANTALALTAPPPFTYLQVRVVQDGAGGWTLSWPASVLWATGSAPVMPTAPGAEMIVTGYWDGANYRFAAGGALNDIPGCSIVARAPNSSGPPVALTAGTNGFVFLRRTDALTAALILDENIDAAAAIAGTKISPNFGSQNIVTTGDVSIGATPSATGDLRTSHGFTMVGRNSINTVDRVLWDWGGTVADNLHIGHSNVTVAINGNTSGQGIVLRTNGTTRFAVSSTNLLAEVPNVLFAFTQTNPIFGQETNPNNGVTGQPLGFTGQNCSGTTTTGGLSYLAGGTGTTTGGEAQLRSSTGTPRVRVNDTGLAFFNVAPVAQPADLGAFVDSTTGTPSGTRTLVDVTTAAVADPVKINNNFATLLAWLTAGTPNLRTAVLRGLGLTA